MHESKHERVRSHPADTILSKQSRGKSLKTARSTYVAMLTSRRLSAENEKTTKPRKKNHRETLHHSGREDLLVRLTALMRGGSTGGENAVTEWEIRQRQLEELQAQERELEKREETVEMFEALSSFNSSIHEAIMLGSFESLHKSFKSPAEVITLNDSIDVTMNYVQHANNDESHSTEAKSNSEEELNFKDTNLTQSVRKLVFKIKEDTLRELEQCRNHAGKRLSDNSDGIQKGANEKVNQSVSAQGSHDDMNVPTSAHHLVLDLKGKANPDRRIASSDNVQSKKNSLSKTPNNRASYQLCPNPNTVTEGRAASFHDSRKKRTSIILPGILKFLKWKKKSNLFTDEELEEIEGARWKIIELAFRFGGKHRYYLAQAVNMFGPLRKYGRRGDPHPTRLQCNRYGTLQWRKKRGVLSSPVDLALVLKISENRKTAVFRRFGDHPELDCRSLSLIFENRTLDLETSSADHRDWLLSALRTLVSYARKQRNAEVLVMKEHDDDEDHFYDRNGQNQEDEPVQTRQSSFIPWQLESLCHKVFGSPQAA